jgi:hypothetical protein
MHRQIIRVAMTCALAVVLPSAARADISIRLSNAQLATTSEVILIGRVVSSETRWIDRTLVTAVSVQIDETLKGGVSGEVEVVLPGGADSKRRIPIAMTFPGAPRMWGGEQVFLFLLHSAEVNGYVVNGFAQGKFSIVTDAAGERRVSRDLRGSQLVEGTGISRGTVTLASLAEFRQEIVGLISQ